MEERILKLESEVLSLTTSLEGSTKPVHKTVQQEIPEQLKRNYSKLHTQGEGQLMPHSTIPSSDHRLTEVQYHHQNSEPNDKNLAPSRQFEDNLERGDIASTLNDDYGEESLFDNSTEQYVDPLLGL
jgi:hypothetical protein